MSFSACMVTSGATPSALWKSNPSGDTSEDCPLAVQRIAPLCSRLGFLFGTSPSKIWHFSLPAAPHHQNQEVKPDSRETFSNNFYKDK